MHCNMEDAYYIREGRWRVRGGRGEGEEYEKKKTRNT